MVDSVIVKLDFSIHRQLAGALSKLQANTRTVTSEETKRF